MGGVLAIDFGTKRLGIAVTDADRRFVLPRDTIERSTLADDLARITAIARADRVEIVVIGLPLNTDGSEGAMAVLARRFGAEVSTATGLALKFADERYTSIEAEEHLRERYPKDTRKRRSLRDRAAAALILKTFLEHGPIP